jgi:hypothetical protein
VYTVDEKGRSMKQKPENPAGMPADGESQEPLTHEQMIQILTQMGWPRTRIDDLLAGREHREHNENRYDFTDARALERLDNEGGAVRLR